MVIFVAGSIYQIQCSAAKGNIAGGSGLVITCAGSGAVDFHFEHIAAVKKDIGNGDTAGAVAGGEGEVFHGSNTVHGAVSCTRFDLDGIAIICCGSCSGNGRGRGARISVFGNVVHIPVHINGDGDAVIAVHARVVACIIGSGSCWGENHTISGSNGRAASATSGKPMHGTFSTGDSDGGIFAAAQGGGRSADACGVVGFGPELNFGAIHGAIDGVGSVGTGIIQLTHYQYCAGATGV